MFRKSALFVSWLFLCYIYSITFIFWQIFPDSEMRANREWNPDKKETTVWWMGIHALICVYVRVCQRLCLKSTRINFGNACLYRLSTFCKTLKKRKSFCIISPFLQRLMTAPFFQTCYFLCILVSDNCTVKEFVRNSHYNISDYCAL